MKLINSASEKREVYIIVVLRKNTTDKRTEEQRKNDTTQEARPEGTQDITYVTIEPTAGKADECDDNPVPLVQEEILVTVTPSKPAGETLDGAGNGSGAKR